MKRTDVGAIETANEEAKSSKDNAMSNFEQEFLKNYSKKKIYTDKDNILNKKSIKLGGNYTVTEMKETINVKQPKDPFAMITKKGDKKVHITENIQYKGTSQNDVFLPRISDKGSSTVFKENAILKLPASSMQNYDPDRVQKTFIRS